MPWSAKIKKMSGGVFKPEKMAKLGCEDQIWISCEENEELFWLLSKQEG